ncbi:MAG TPA: hypothetical protein VFP89_09180 [Propionibacteriaceae bacterium]|nr:hypothetical protein [Propionibacteriaceae bacterium]
MLSYFRPWRDAWAESSYGPAGHWRSAWPSDHFRTAATTTTVLSELLLAELSGRPQIGTVIELGAGDGTLLGQIGRCRPDLRLFGVDIRQRPAALPSAVTWYQDCWDVRTDCWTSGQAARAFQLRDHSIQDLERLGDAAQASAPLEGPTLLVAVEWLDDLPMVIARRDPLLRQLETDDTGDERLGLPVVGADRDWAQHWWPHGSRVEIGLSRDRAWADAVGRLQPRGGIAVVVDYGHDLAHRPVEGSLTGYAFGRQRPPVPDASMNLTAHVAVDAVRAAGERAGAVTVRQARLSELVSQLPPTHDTDPLADLSRRSHRAAAASPTAWGAVHWLCQEVRARP